MPQIINFDSEVPFGKLAENFGRNLGESINTQFQKEMTAKGVEDVLTKSKANPNISNLDLYTQLIRTPGMTPQEAQQLIPYIREQFRTEDLRNRYKKVPSDDQTQSPIASNAPLSEGISQPIQQDDQIVQSKPVLQSDISQKGKERLDLLGIDPKSFTGLDPVKESLENLTEVTQEKIYQRASEILNSEDPRFTTDATAIPEAERQLNQEKNLKLELRTEIERAENKLDKRLSKQIGADFATKLGRVYPRILDLAQKDVFLGELTPEGASKKYGKISEDLNKQINNLQNYEKASMFSGPSDKTKGQLGLMQKKFDKLGSLDVFSELMQANLNISKPLSQAIAFPSSEGLNKALQKIESATKIMPSAKEAFSVGKAIERKSKEISNNLIDKITPKDSLYSVALELNSKGYDENHFFDTVTKRVNNGEMVLSDFQQEELSSREPITFSLSDLWLSVKNNFTGGKNQLPLSTKIARNLGGR